MPIPLKFKLSSEADSAYASTKTGTGTATLNVQCPENTGRAQRTQDFQVTVGTAYETVSTLQYGAATFVRWSNTGTTTVSKDTTSLSLTGYSNSSTLSFSTAATGGLAVTIGTVRWMEADATDTGSNGTALSGINVTGDPGATRQYKFVVALTFAANAGATAKTCTVTVTGAGTGVTSTATISQGGEAYLTVSPASLTATAASGTQTFTVTTNSSNLSVTETTSSTILSVVSVTNNGNNTWEVVVHWSVNRYASSRNIGTLLFSMPEDTSLNKTISVTQDGAASGLVLQAAKNAIHIGDSLVITAYIYGLYDEPTTGVSWACLPHSVASISSQTDSTCTIAGLGEGTVRVTANKEGYLPAYKDIAVSAVIHVQSITVEPAEGLSLNIGDTGTVTADILPLDAEFTPVFASSDDTIAEVVPATGEVVARRAGTCQITATADGVTSSNSVSIVVQADATISVWCVSATRPRTGTAAQMAQVTYSLFYQNTMASSVSTNVLVELVEAANEEDVAGATALTSQTLSLTLGYITGSALAATGTIGNLAVRDSTRTFWIRVSGTYESRHWSSYTPVTYESDADPDPLPRD